MMNTANSFNRIIRAPGPHSRIEAQFSGQAFAPHRHDSFTIAVTIRGVQSFRYRGELRYSQPGEIVVLHPDEMHDGMAGTEEGFCYRALRLAPATMQTILCGTPLPFLPEGTSTDQSLLRAIAPALENLDAPMSTLAWQDCCYDTTIALARLARQSRQSRKCDYHAAERARDYIHAHLDSDICLDQLSSVADRDRWQLSRDFRALFGTSPYRYLTMRRLEYSCHELAAGLGIADVAIKYGFSDQSHFTRQFRKTFGMTPRHWLHSIDAQSFYKSDSGATYAGTHGDHKPTH